MIKNRRKKQRKPKKEKATTPPSGHPPTKYSNSNHTQKGEKPYRSRFKFHTTELESEINKEIQTRKRLAIQIAEDKWNEAKAANEETKEETRQQAVEAHKHAREAIKDAKEYEPKIHTGRTPRHAGQKNPNKHL